MNRPLNQHPLSLVIIAFNESDHLPRLLASVPVGVEVIVLDSNSTDGSQEIVQRFGAKLFQRPFDNYAAQKNAAIAYATRDWILSLDADEQPSQELWDEVLLFMKNHPTRDAALRVRRQLVFLGRDMRFGKTSDAPLRLWPNGNGSFDGKIHEEFVLTAGISVTTSRAVLKHFSYRDLSDYFLRFNRYTSRIAQNHLEQNTACPSPLTMATRLPIEFVSRYFVRLGFLDGYPGFVYALLSTGYAFVKYAKLIELKDAVKAKTP